MLDLTREYLLLGLRFNKLVDGFVDAYFGDPALSKQVDGEPTPDADALGRRAVELRAELPSSGLSPQRQRFLDGQLAALAVSGRKLGGEKIGFVDEVEAYFQRRPAMEDEAVYAAAHAALEPLLPGSGSLTERYHAYKKADEIDPARLSDAVHAISSALRDRVRATYGLPEQEVVEYVIETDKPWSGFNYYLGDYRSKVAINADLPSPMAGLGALVAHESYPGHHTEHARKERLLVDQAAEPMPEQTIFLVNTPECLMAEGLADLGLRVSVGKGWGLWLEEIYADLGLRFDGQRAEAIGQALKPLGSISQNAALLLHDRGSSVDDVIAYFERWRLSPRPRAEKSIQSLTDPLWRAYTSTYVEGERLLESWLDAGDETEQFRRLLDEPLTPAQVAEEIAV